MRYDTIENTIEDINNLYTELGEDTVWNYYEIYALQKWFPLENLRESFKKVKSEYIQELKNRDYQGKFVEQIKSGKSYKDIQSPFTADRLMLEFKRPYVVLPWEKTFNPGALNKIYKRGLDEYVRFYMDKHCKYIAHSVQ